MIQLYHGDGKGKTTAAVGAGIRAAGAGKKVVFMQFMKGGQTGEIPVLASVPGMTVLRSGKDFGFYSALSEEDKKELKGIHDDLLEKTVIMLRNRETDFVILDEITHAFHYDLASEDKLNTILTFGREDKAEIILTGRDPSKGLMECSDYISKIVCVRHPYQKGVPARRGIEY